jgi:hypothetical protein
MKCFHHPSEDAVTTCALCGVGLCKECEETSEFRKDRRALCKRCNAECRTEEYAHDLAEYKRQKRRLIWFSILFVPGISIFAICALDNQLITGIAGCLLIWGISGIGAAIRDTFSPATRSRKQDMKEALAEHEYPLASLIGKVVGFVIQLIFSYIVYALTLPVKLGYSIVFVVSHKNNFNNQAS